MKVTDNRWRTAVHRLEQQ